MLSPIIKKKIESKYGSPIRYPKDCEALAKSISMVSKSQISGSTIKRLFGLIKGTNTPRLWTLDVIAFYLDYQSWDSLINEIANNKESNKKQIEKILSKDVVQSQTFKIAFGDKASIILKYIGKCQYVVSDASKIALLNQDVIEVKEIKLHHPLLIKKIKRNTEVMEGLLIGSITGVTNIAELKSNSPSVSLNKIPINSNH